MKRLLILPVLLWLTACNAIAPLAGLGGLTPTPTECGCELKVTPFATTAGGLTQAGPAAPGAETPSAVQEGWQTYTNPAYGFSFDYPTAYTSQEFGFCAARDAINAPADAFMALDLGSRTQISLTKTSLELAGAVDAYKADPAHQSFQFESPTERTVGGVPAIILPYRSGGTNRYAEAAFFIKDGVLYRVDTGTPSACDIPAINLTELSAYSRVLDSFKFK